MEKPIFKTELTKVEYSILILFLGLIIFGLLNYKFFIDFTFFEMLLVLFGFSSIIFKILTIKIFIIQQDQLIVKRPFLFFNNFDITINTNDIRKIIITHRGQRFGGNYIMNIVFFSKVKKENKEYEFDNGFKQLENFIVKLRSIGIEIKDDIATSF